MYDRCFKKNKLILYHLLLFIIVRIDLKPVDVFNSLMRGQKKSSLHFVNPYYTIGI